MHKIFFVLIACGPLVVNPGSALAGNIVVGVNAQGIEKMTDQQQDALIDQLQKNGVKAVRIGIGNRYNRFIIEAQQHGIGAEVFVFWPALGDNASGSRGIQGLGYNRARSDRSGRGPANRVRARQRDQFTVFQRRFPSKPGDRTCSRIIGSR